MGKLRSIPRHRKKIRPCEGGSNPYQYGYPTTSNPNEPNVALQWIFHEASGNIVDTVAGVSLAATGSPTYNVNTLVYSSAMSPGITIITPGATTYFSKAGVDANADIGTSDFTFEYSYIPTGTLGNNGALISTNDADFTKGYRFNTNFATNNIVLDLLADDGSSVSPSWSNLSPSPMSSGVPYKLRLVGVRSGNASLYINDTLQGSVSIASLSGKAITAQNLFLFARTTGNFAFHTQTAVEFRLSLNSTNKTRGPGD